MVRQWSTPPSEEDDIFSSCWSLDASSDVAAQQCQRRASAAVEEIRSSIERREKPSRWELIRSSIVGSGAAAEEKESEAADPETDGRREAEAAVPAAPDRDELADYIRLKVETAELRARLEIATASLDEANDTIKQIQIRNDELGLDNLSLREKNSELGGEIARLTEENSRLVAELSASKGEGERPSERTPSWFGRFSRRAGRARDEDGGGDSGTEQSSACDTCSSSFDGAGSPDDRDGRDPSDLSAVTALVDNTARHRRPGGRSSFSSQNNLPRASSRYFDDDASSASSSSRRSRHSFLTRQSDDAESVGCDDTDLMKSVKKRHFRPRCSGISERDEIPDDYDDIGVRAASNRGEDGRRFSNVSAVLTTEDSLARCSYSGWELPCSL